MAFATCNNVVIAISLLLITNGTPPYGRPLRTPLDTSEDMAEVGIMNIIWKDTAECR